jgi:hypothetical protein
MGSSRHVCVLALMALLFGAYTKAPAAEHGEHDVKWAGHIFREVTSLSALPPSVQAALGVGRTGSDGIADRNGKYNPTDVVDSSLPMRRFLIAGLDQDTALVAVEHGGRGWRVEVFLFADTNNIPTIKRRWIINKSIQSLPALVDNLRR